MGNDSISWEVHGRLSRHNSPRDNHDNDLWDKMTAELAAICDKPEYASVMMFHSDPSQFEDWHRWD